MTDNPDTWTEAGAEGPESLTQLLRDPAVWARPSGDVGDRVLAAIAAERSARAQAPIPEVDHRWPPPTHPRRAEPGPVGPSVTDQLPPRAEEPPPSVTASGAVPPPADGDADGWGEPTRQRGRRRSVSRRWLPLATAAAVAVLALGALAAVNLRSTDQSNTQVVALAPTEAAPLGAVVANVTERPNGVRVVLDLSGLPPAPDGFLYQAWLVRPEPRNAVSAGTWHMRGGDGTIELWAGVSTKEYSTISVTMSPESDPTSPGDRLFAGQLSTD